MLSADTRDRRNPGKTKRPRRKKQEDEFDVNIRPNASALKLQMLKLEDREMRKEALGSLEEKGMPPPASPAPPPPPPPAPSVPVEEEARKKEDEEASEASDIYWSQTNFENFCRSTSMHGWFFVVDESLGHGFYAVCTKFFWVLVVLLSLILTLAFMIVIVLDYEQEKVQTTFVFEKGNWQGIKFPSVAICNKNQIRTSFLQRYDIDPNGTDRLLRLVGHIYTGQKDHPEVLQELASENNLGSIAREAYCVKLLYNFAGTSLEEFMRTDFLKCRDANTLTKFNVDLFRLAAIQDVTKSNVLRASYQGVLKSVDSFGSLFPFFETDVGYCTYIRPPATFASPSREPFPRVLQKQTSAKGSIKLGRDNGLSILLDTEIYDQGWTFTESDGFLVALHQLEDFPHMTYSTLHVNPGHNVKLAVEPIIKETDDSALKYQIADRKCYTEDELKLNYLLQDRFRYSWNNCVLESIHRSAREECGCRRGIDPELYGRVGYEVVPHQATERHFDATPPCVGDGLRCYRDRLNNYAYVEKVEVRNGVEFDCLPPCQDEEFKVSMTSSTYPNRNAMERDQGFFCLVFRKIRAVCLDARKRTSLGSLYREALAYDICAEVTAAESKDDEVASKSVLENVCNSCEYVVQEEITQHGVPKRCTNDSKGHRYSHMIDKCATVASDDYHNCIEKVHVIQTFVYKYATDNLVRIDVFVKDTNLDKIVVSEKQSIVALLSNIGGMTGLATGCSLITLCEIIYFTFNYFLHVQTHLRNRAVDQIHEQRHDEVVMERAKLRGILRDMTGFRKDEAANRMAYAQRLEDERRGRLEVPLSRPRSSTV